MCCRSQYMYEQEAQPTTGPYSRGTDELRFALNIERGRPEGLNLRRVAQKRLVRRTKRQACADRDHNANIRNLFELHFRSLKTGTDRGPSHLQASMSQRRGALRMRRANLAVMCRAAHY